MKPSILLMFFLLMAMQANTQINTLTGKIIDAETKEPIISAHVYIPDLQKGTVANAEGIFELNHLPEGLFLIEFGFLGYSTQVLKIKVQGETKIDIELTPSITEISEIVVTGTSASTERELNPVPTIVVNNLVSNEMTSTNIIDALSKQPGISQITTGGAISKPVIRGLGYNRVIVLNNNMRQEGQQWGDEHGIELDEFSVDRVEIIKGPGSLMYGSDAMAGVIHFLSPKPVTEGSITGQLVANYQTNNQLMGFSAMNAGNLNGINWLARVSSKTAGNYSNRYDGKVYNSGFKELNYNGSIGINKRWGYSQLYFSSFNQSLGLIEGDRDSLGHFIKTVVVSDTLLEEQTVTDSDLSGYQISIPSQDIGHLKIGSSTKLFLNKSILSLNLGFQRNTRKEFADPFNENAVELSFLLNTFTYDAKYLFPEINKWQTSAGISGMQQNSQNKGEEFLIPEYNLFDIGLYAFTQRTFDRLHISGGLRYDIRNLNSMPLYLNGDDEPTDGSDPSATIKFEEFNTTYSNFSGSIGASYQITRELTSKFNISRGFRSPNIAELGSNGLHEGTFRYEIGNNKLKPETSLQLDAGLLFNTEHISFELALFNNSIQQYIFVEKLNSMFGGDSIIDPSDPIPAFKFVQGNANLYGGEISIDIHPHPWDWLHFQNSFSFVRGKQLNQPDSTKYLPFMPAPRIQSELRANFNTAGAHLRNLYFRIELEYTFLQNEILSAYGTETPTSGYALLSTGIGTDITNKSGDPFCSISIAASNLLDAAYQSHLSRLKYAPENLATGRQGVFNMGRNFSLRLMVPLTFKNPT